MGDPEEALDQHPSLALCYWEPSVVPRQQSSGIWGLVLEAKSQTRPSPVEMESPERGPAVCFIALPVIPLLAGFGGPLLWETESPAPFQLLSTVSQ